MRNNSTLTVLIFTRDITYNPEKLTIYARITVDGRRAEISLKRYVGVNVWDVSKGRVIGTTQKARILNSYLDEVYVQLMDAHKQLLQEGKMITAQAIKARYLGLSYSSLLGTILLNAELTLITLPFCVNHKMGFEYSLKAISVQ